MKITNRLTQVIHKNKISIRCLILNWNKGLDQQLLELLELKQKNMQNRLKPFKIHWNKTKLLFIQILVLLCSRLKDTVTKRSINLWANNRSNIFTKRSFSFVFKSSSASASLLLISNNKEELLMELKVLKNPVLPFRRTFSFQTWSFILVFWLLLEMESTCASLSFIIQKNSTILLKCLFLLSW